MARRRKPAKPELGRTTYHGHDEDGTELFPPQPHAVFALLRAQRIAEMTPEERTYYIERQTLFGAPHDVYMVERDAAGAVRTYTLSRED